VPIYFSDLRSSNILTPAKPTFRWSASCADDRLQQCCSIATEEDTQLLKCLVLGLRGKLPYEQATQSTEYGEDIGTILHRAEHILGGKADNEVEHPVDGGDDRDTAGALTVGEDFLGQYLRDGSYSIKC
jgi:hypothetical protein